MLTRQEYYEKYEDFAKLDLAAKHELERLVGEIVEVLRKAGVRNERGHEPMSDIYQMNFEFPADGVYRDFGLSVCSQKSCWLVVAMEPEPGEEASQEHVMNEEGRVRTP